MYMYLAKNYLVVSFNKKAKEYDRAIIIFLYLQGTYDQQKKKKRCVAKKDPDITAILSSVVQITDANHYDFVCC